VTSEGSGSRTGGRRTVLIVSLVAILVLAGIGASLVTLTSTDGSGDDDDRVAAGGPDADGVSFTDPQGAYTLDIDPRWRASEHATTPEVESWFTGTGTVDFRDNVNIVTQQIGQMALDEYMKLVTDQAHETVPDYDLREFRIVTASDDPASDTTAEVPLQLGVFAYDGENSGKDFGFLFIASVENGRAVLATLTTPEDRFDRVRAQVEPYLMTIRQT
jgi:hypothetical protein